jgi:hypothetical protein
MMQRYKDDPGGRDDAAYWLLTKDSRWLTNARWREALWANDAYTGPNFPFAPPSPLSLPLSKFFGAQNLGNFRSGSWDGPTAEWALLTIAAHPLQPESTTRRTRGPSASTPPGRTSRSTPATPGCRPIRRSRS